MVPHKEGTKHKVWDAVTLRSGGEGDQIIISIMIETVLKKPKKGQTVYLEALKKHQTSFVVLLFL